MRAQCIHWGLWLCRQSVIPVITVDLVEVVFHVKSEKENKIKWDENTFFSRYSLHCKRRARRECVMPPACCMQLNALHLTACCHWCCAGSKKEAGGCYSLLLPPPGPVLLVILFTTAASARVIAEEKTSERSWLSLTITLLGKFKWNITIYGHHLQFNLRGDSNCLRR